MHVCVCVCMCMCMCACVCARARACVCVRGAYGREVANSVVDADACGEREALVDLALVVDAGDGVLHKLPPSKSSR